MTRATRPAGLRIAKVPGEAELATFVGDRTVCACHPTEGSEHAGSGHSHTFHPAATHPRIRTLDGTKHPDPEHKGVTWAYALRNGQAYVDRIDAKGPQALLIDFVFGSGQHSNTFVSLDAADPTQPHALEHRLTFYAGRTRSGSRPGRRPTSLKARRRTIGRILESDRDVQVFRVPHARRPPLGIGPGSTWRRR